MRNNKNAHTFRSFVKHIQWYISTSFLRTRVGLMRIHSRLFIFNLHITLFNLKIPQIRNIHIRKMSQPNQNNIQTGKLRDKDGKFIKKPISSYMTDMRNAHGSPPVMTVDNDMVDNDMVGETRSSRGRGPTRGRSDRGRSSSCRFSYTAYRRMTHDPITQSCIENPWASRKRARDSTEKMYVHLNGVDPKTINIKLDQKTGLMTVKGSCSKVCETGRGIRTTNSNVEETVQHREER